MFKEIAITIFSLVTSPDLRGKNYWEKRKIKILF